MIERKTLADAVRILSLDAVEKAHSGHPGAPMGMADVAEVLWNDYMNHNPSNPRWINRDRFVLSNGHASMLLYSVLHLTGYNVSMHDIKNFRQMRSKTPGHPEWDKTDGVEITTGPLGQGMANAIGFAIGERLLSQQFNRPRFKIIDHYTYVFLGDGCMMEGISHESCSLAGALGLNRLVAFYDSNGISIDGEVKPWFNDNTALRFRSYGWHVVDDVDGHDFVQIRSAVEEARAVSDRPVLIVCRTVLAYGSPHQSGKSSAHGAPLGADEVSASRRALQWKHPPFVIPEKIYAAWDARKAGERKEKKWKTMFRRYCVRYPRLAKELHRRIHNKLPKVWDTEHDRIVRQCRSRTQSDSSRQISHWILEQLCPMLPEIVGGSADLTPSNLTRWSKSCSFNGKLQGNYIHYGVREFGMTAIANGISRYGGFLPYTATFLVFSEYACNAIRMAALMRLRHIMVYTHDSVGLGEDGPTHQPVEQLSHLRTVPNVVVWRPCNRLETAVSWRKAVERVHGPTVLALSRQNLECSSLLQSKVKHVERGGYVALHGGRRVDLILIATGSEVHLAAQVHARLSSAGHSVRLVSMPSTNVFDRQDKRYRDSVLPPSVVLRLAIEAGKTDFWFKYVGLQGKVIGIDRFGESAPAKEVFDLFRFDVDRIVRIAETLMRNTRIDHG